jgi:hypothetical protein
LLFRQHMLVWLCVSEAIMSPVPRIASLFSLLFLVLRLSGTKKPGRISSFRSRLGGFLFFLGVFPSYRLGVPIGRMRWFMAGGRT